MEHSNLSTELNNYTNISFMIVRIQAPHDGKIQNINIAYNIAFWDKNKMTIWNTWIGIWREIKQISLRQICFWQICFYITLRQCWALYIIFKILMRVLSYKDVLWNYYAIQYALIQIQLTYTPAIASYCSENYYYMLHVTHKVPEMFNQITLKYIYIKNSFKHII